MKHGTSTGARDHYRRGEKPCEACRKAANKRRSNPKPRKLRPHGTLAAYRRHQRHNEKPCAACLAEYNSKRKERRKIRREEPGEKITWVKRRGIFRRKT